MEPETKEKLLEIEKRIEATYDSAEKTRKYILVLMWVAIIAFLLPLIVLALVVPQFVEIYSSIGI